MSAIGPGSLGICSAFRSVSGKVRFVARQKTHLNLVRHMVVTIVGSLDIQGVAIGVGRHTKHSGTERREMTRIEPPQGSPACADKLDGRNIGT